MHKRVFLTVGVLLLASCGSSAAETRVESVAKSVCEKDIECRPVLLGSEYEDLSDCKQQRVEEFEDLDGEGCLDAALDFSACYATLNCQELTRNDGNFENGGCGAEYEKADGICPEGWN